MKGTRRFLDAVQRSANRLVKFSGDHRSIRLTVEVTAGCREEALGAEDISLIHHQCVDDRKILAPSHKQHGGDVRAATKSEDTDDPPV
jgi:hypothetical protein